VTVRNTRASRIAISAVAVAALAGVGASAANGSGSVNFVAYAVPQPAFDKIIPLFQKSKIGKGTQFTTSYGASGDQSRAVANGAPADFVNFSVAPDIGRLVTAGLVNPSYESELPNRAVPASTVVVLGVRKGNPLKIRNWDDIVKPGVKIVTADYKTSGAAKWNALAAWGQAKARGKSNEEAQAFLVNFYKNVVVQAKSGRELTQAFAAGQGDVAIQYEFEAQEAVKNGVAQDYVIPTPTMVISSPVAAIQTSSNLKTARQFGKFLYTPEAQQAYGSVGFIPFLKSYKKKGKTIRIKTTARKAGKTFNINFFGGWTKADVDFFGPRGYATKARSEVGK
jgi:sulfate/thiosulfate transport system substrate-binding protein